MKKPLDTFCNSDNLIPDMKIRKNDIVTNNKELTVGTFYTKVVPAGTQLRVWKTTRDGKLYCSADHTVTSQTIVIASSEVSKVEKPLPTVRVGDIFVSSWGYDQTNVDFYKVLNVKNKTAVLVEIGQTRNYTGHMQGICIPDPTVMGKKTLTKRIQSYRDTPFFKIASYASASPWDGKNEHFSEWA